MRRPSIGARILKSLARFFATVLIGIGLTLAWQTYGEQAKQFTTTLVPSLAWLLPAENAKTAPEVTTSSDLMQQMKLVAVDVAMVRRDLVQLATGQEQFAAKQDQMSRNITSLQEVEQTRAQALAPPVARVIRPSPPARIVPQVPSR
jgi:hypothetical protein